jgi:hypothetical protein
MQRLVCQVREQDAALEQAPGKELPSVKAALRASNPGGPMQVLVPYEAAEPDQASPFLNTPAQHPGHKGLRCSPCSSYEPLP